VAVVGKQVAGILSLTPILSDFPFCFRTPCGPSAKKMEGSISLAILLVVQKSFPEHNEAFSFRLID
jgi:hypothetical protein